MYEINVKDLTTASHDFSIARDAILKRFMKFHDRHNPGGTPLPKHDFSWRKRAACSIATIIIQHSLVVMGAFRKGWYAPGLTLLRPTLEAVLRVAALRSRGDKSDWEVILFNEKRFKVTHGRLSATSKDTGLPDLGPLWREISGPINDLLHLRGGQVLTAIGDESGHQAVLSNPIEQSREPVYHAGLIWEAALMATLALASTHCITWELLGDENRAKRCREDLLNEDWDRVETSRNGQTVYIVCGQAGAA
jgi:hypothetical protein